MKRPNILEKFGFNLHKIWHCNFPLEHLSIENKPQVTLFHESRIDKLAARMNLEGLRVLELGCLEGAQSFSLQSFGVKEVIAIEGREDNFIKCLIIKNAFKLNKCKFIYGNLNEVLTLINGDDIFDLCVASGIFYHLLNPISAIYQVGRLAKALFIWTHYATEECPPSRDSVIKYQGHTYKGKYVKERTKHYLSGLNRESFWIFEKDIFNALKNAGFKNIEVISKEKDGDKPAITLLARK